VCGLHFCGERIMFVERGLWWDSLYLVASQVDFSPCDGVFDSVVIECGHGVGFVIIVKALAVPMESSANVCWTISFTMSPHSPLLMNLSSIGFGWICSVELLLP
jgi:hypothetical protein